MERLTYRDSDGRSHLTTLGARMYCSVQATADYIAKLEEILTAYKDTGLTPEEIEELLHDSTGPLHKKLGKWIKAEAEGRLIVLPETVYQHDAERIYESKVRRVIYETDAGFAFDERAIGQTVFLTREEAEAALKERTG